MTTSHSGRRRYVAVAAIAVAAFAVLGLSAPASAAEPDPGQNGSASLIIHKYAGDTSSLPHDGTDVTSQIDTSANPPLEGVGFSVYRVTSTADSTVPDLETNAGWQNVKSLESNVGIHPSNSDLTGAGYTVTQVGAEQTTNASGVTTFDNLDFGLYYVTESSPLSGYDPIQPFLVTVPLTDQGTTGTSGGASSSWLYNVNVYPKNQAIEAKQVDDIDAVKTGDTVTWTIHGNIPEDTVSGYQVRDDLDQRLDYQAARVYLGTEKLTEGTDYTLATSALSAPKSTRVNVKFTSTGLAKLSDPAAKNEKVAVEVDTTVTGVGDIPNDATIFDNADAIDDDTPTTDVPGTSTEWGSVTVTKDDVDDSSVTLQGAVFEVYSSKTDDFSTATDTGLSGTTGSDGTTTIQQLRYSDHVNGADISEGDSGYLYYWLVEKKAPAGYEILPSPIAFQVTSTNTDASFDYAITVSDVPHNGGFMLPMTGGVVHAWMFYLAGGLVLVGAALMLIRMRAARAAR